MSELSNSVHPLKSVGLLAIIGLLTTQLSLLFFSGNEGINWLGALLSLPLIIPLHGLIKDKRYTWQWTGFLTLPYFMIGVSESFGNPGYRIYAVITLAFSIAAFISAIYYSRLLKHSP